MLKIMTRQVAVRCNKEPVSDSLTTTKFTTRQVNDKHKVNLWPQFAIMALIK